jgi:hypothetical protein
MAKAGMVIKESVIAVRISVRVFIVVPPRLGSAAVLAAVKM